MPDEHRDPWGRLVVEPDRLPMPARVDELRKVAGRLQAEQDRGARWVGQAFAAWLSGQAPTVEAALGVGTRTPQRLVQRDALRRTLRAFIVAMGGKSAAARALQGREVPRGQAAAMLAELKAMGCPTSRSGIIRALD